MQATAADGFKKALVAIDRGIQGFGARIFYILHDEMIVEARLDEVERVAWVVKESMAAAFNEMLPGMPFAVKTKVLGRWNG